MSRIVTLDPPISLFETHRLALTTDWQTLYRVPFYADTYEVSPTVNDAFTFANFVASSFLVTNLGDAAATFDLQISPLGRLPKRAATVTVPPDGASRLEFKGSGVLLDNVGAVLDWVRLLDADRNDYILNGSFEDITGLTKTGFGYRGVGAIPGWTDYEPTTLLDLVTDTRLGIVPANGAIWLDTRGDYSALHPRDGNIWIYQDVTGLTPGETYELVFYYGDDSDRGNTLEVFWNDEPVVVNGATALDPVVVRDLVRTQSVPARQTVNVLSKSIFFSGDEIRLRSAAGSGLHVSMSGVLATREKYQTAIGA